jgi:AraC-like DNA-binding protein
MQDKFKEEKIKLSKLILDKCNNKDGSFKTDIPFLHFFTTSTKTNFVHVIYEPSICIALQGSKEVYFGKNQKGYDEHTYLLSSTNIPANIRIEDTSKEKPYVSLKITFTLEQIYEVMKEIGEDNIPSKKKTDAGLFFDELTMELLDPVSRLIKLLDTPKRNRDFMSKLVLKEFLFILLNGQSGEFLKQYVMEGSITNQIVKIISKLKEDFAESINMKEIADEFDMSESSLYHSFKKITMISPLQFQKKLRLEEAKNLLISTNIDVSEVAFQVGYESPSQFSREYSRMFGMSPKAHINSIKS